MQGHLLLIGVSGAGKTTLSRFVAWINGLSVFQIKVNMHVDYTGHMYGKRCVDDDHNFFPQLTIPWGLLLIFFQTLHFSIAPLCSYFNNRELPLNAIALPRSIASILRQTLTTTFVLCCDALAAGMRR